MSHPTTRTRNARCTELTRIIVAETEAMNDLRRRISALKRERDNLAMGRKK